MITRTERELAKRLPGPSQIERVRAARAIIHSRSGSEAMALRGFMAIFHPKTPEHVVSDMVRDLQR